MTKMRKVLFIGLGSIGQRHLVNLKKIRPDVKIYYYDSGLGSGLIINDLQIIKTEKNIKEFYNIEIRYVDLDKALNENHYDLVFICNPSSLHISVALKVAEHGYNIFIEKPLSNSLEGILKLQKLIELNDLKVFIGYQMRLHPCLIKLKGLLNKHILGNLISVIIEHGSYMPDFHKWGDYRESYCSKKSLGGGVALTQIHEFDYLLWLFGDISWISSVSNRSGDLEIDVEDSVDCFMGMGKRNKLPVHLHLNFLQKKQSRFIIIISEIGITYIDLINNNIKINDVSEFSFIFEQNTLFINMLKKVIISIETGKDKSQLVYFEEGVKSLQLALEGKK